MKDKLERQPQANFQYYGVQRFEWGI